MSSHRLIVCLAIALGAFGQTPQFVPGSTTPRIQLNGENFQISSNGQYFTPLTQGRTLSTSGALGADLAFPIVFPDKIVLLFGDTFGAYQSGPRYMQSASVPPNGADDSIGYLPNVDLSQCHYISDVDQQLSQGVTNPSVSFGACPPLHLYANPSHPPNQHIFQATPIAGLLNGENLGPYHVPTGAVAYNNRLYMFYITETQPDPAGTPFNLQSIMARSNQDPETWSDTNPPTFTRLFTVSSYPPLADPNNPPAEAGSVGKFMFCSPVLLDSGTLAGAGLTQGLPAALQNAANVVFVWASSYLSSRSNLFLAAFALSDIEAGPAKWYYYKTNNQWSANEADAAPLLPAGEYSGTQSVAWNSALRRFVLMHSPGVVAQFATAPWGPWSTPAAVFSKDDPWGRKLIHHPGQDQIVRSLITLYDSSGNPVDINNDVAGVPYTPNLVNRFTQNPDGSVTLYYLLSMWNPYEVFLMSSTFTTGLATGPVVSLVANAAGESPSIAPNTWVEIKGANLAPPGDTRIWQTADFVNNQMPTQLDGVSVKVNGKSAFVYYISPTQVNILTPPDAMQGQVPVALTNAGVTSSAVNVQAQPLSPSFFVFNLVPYVAAEHADGSLLGPTSLYAGLSTPAKPGETVVLYANGFGPTTTPVVSGSTTQGGTLTPLPVVKIGGANALVVFAGLVAAGEYQFNVVVPATTPDGDQPVTATYNGATTQPGTLIAIQH